MTPISHFNSAWERCEELAALHSYLSSHLTGAIKPDEILRAEWVSRVSALDLYVHELVAQNMLAVFNGARATSPAYSKFQIPTETLSRIRSANSSTEASQYFDLEVRTRLGFNSYQDPEKIADGIRLVSPIELWNEVALHLGATQQTKLVQARSLKRSLSIIVERRNKIAHEGDLQPTLPRLPWPIAKEDLQHVKSTIESLVRAIDQLV